MGCFSSLPHHIYNHHAPVDPVGQERHVRNAPPKILGTDERCEMAFKGGGGKGRDFVMFTTRRMLVSTTRARADQGLVAEKFTVEYRSCPYDTIKAFAVETSGSERDPWNLTDMSDTLSVWAKGVGIIKINVAPGIVDAFSLKRYLNKNIFAKKCVGVPVPVIGIPVGPEHSTVRHLLDFLNKNSAMLNLREIEARLRAKGEFLVDDEHIELAFKVNNNADFTCFTNKRIFMIDIKGSAGTKREYVSILWGYCSCFALENSRVVIYHTVQGRGNVIQDFQGSRVNILEIQTYLSNKILGMDTQSKHGVPTTPDVDRASVQKKEGGFMASLREWLGDDMKMFDPKEADARFHASGATPMLHGCEKVEMAFKGRRDMVLFTTKRFIHMDIQEGNKSSCSWSLPWKAISAFSVVSAISWGKDSASVWDQGSELKLWTEFNDISPGINPDEEGEGKLPEPGWSCKSVAFRKDKVDLFGIQQYLAQRIIPAVNKQTYRPPGLDLSIIQNDAKKDSGIMGWMSGLMDELGPDYTKISTGPMEQQLKKEPPVLLKDETVVMAFKSGRDLWLYTTRRLFKIDTQGWSGKKVEYLSIPYKSIKAFSVECAGSWDRCAEINIYIQSPWMPQIKQDLRAGRADIIVIQNFLAGQVLGMTGGGSGLDEDGVNAAADIADQAAKKSGSISKFFDWIGDNSRNISAKEINQQFHESPQILMSDEKVELAFQCGRNMFVITNKRFLMADVQGLTANKVKYLTIPLQSCATFSVASSGTCDFNGSSLLTDIPYRDHLANTCYWEIRENFFDSKVDLISVQEWLSWKLVAKSHEVELMATAAISCESNPQSAAIQSTRDLF